MKINLGSFLAKRARLSPNLEAVVEVERKRAFSYAELDARANRIANVLLAMGVQKGRSRSVAGNERRRVYRELLRRGQDRRRFGSIELAAGSR